MAEVTVRVPGLLARFTGGDREVAVEADTVGGCIDRLVERYPGIEVHLLDGQGALRAHVLLFADGEQVAWSDRAAAELADGATVTVLQSVSGG